ncbi:cytochrome c oxidase subunit 4 [Kitasatospora sp. RB6PN24]|uniref:aa3-type cytochrome oxidase subunit IV n=1 Tax=Kitasatospora humi TaxID=2893891 RepID=UPI001E5F5387|nr:cytochrome c oxidase subunit 4 [Kitasatospora humi]MCC9305576.1 cytochrome c oxidase subunit 4 [Kitasatospora humi]
MKSEAWLFTGWACFFAILATTYGVFAHEPAGKAALVVAFLMSSLVAAFCWGQLVKQGRRLSDDPDAEVAAGTGPLAFFSPSSVYPVWTAAGAAVTALGVIYGWWLLLIGFAVLAPGVAGFVFQHALRGQ